MSGLDGYGSKFPNGLNVDKDELFIADIAVTTTAAELNLIDGSIAGTAVASKALVLDANKKVDTIGLSTGAFISGARFSATYGQIAAADVAKTFFIAPVACKVIEAQERHVTVAGQAGTLQIEKLTSGQAPSAGVLTLLTAFDLVSTANISVAKGPTATAADALMAKGDALCLKLASGNAASYALGTITVTLEVI